MRERDPFDLDQQFGTANVGHSINSGHQAKSPFADCLASLKILRTPEINADFRQVMQPGTRTVNAMESEVLRSDQPLDIVDRLLGLPDDIARVTAVAAKECRRAATKATS